MDLLENVIQPYPWGSRVALAEMLGRPSPAEGPQAELWMGAHPSGPSQIVRDGRKTTLEAAIAEDPLRELGVECVDHFGPRLPFLLKVLAMDAALSIQTHPTREQAIAGFAAENARGLAPGDPKRNYVDDWPKPEILCALTPCEALAGLRTAVDAADVLAWLDVPALTPIVDRLRAYPVAETVAQALGDLLAAPDLERPSLVADVLEACERGAVQDTPYAPAYGAVVRIHGDHPGDIGVVCSLLLNHVIVEPGQALFLVAGGLHAYIRGVGVELMANSDNVLRAGLTSKHIDAAELLRVMDPGVDVPVLAARQLEVGIEVFDTAVPEFQLYRLAPDSRTGAVRIPGEGPRIVLCVAGRGSVVSSRASGASSAELLLGRGEACFIPASEPDVQVSGPATLFVAAPGV